MSHRWLLTLLALLSPSPTLAADTPSTLVVWSGDNPQGQTWAKLGPKGSISVVDGAGHGPNKKALVLFMDGDGYRGCGLNWKGWFPEDACDDASGYTSLTFFIRQVTKVADADLSITLVDNLKHKEGEAVSNTLQVLADGGLKQNRRHLASGQVAAVWIHARKDPAIEQALGPGHLKCRQQRVALRIRRYRVFER